jgi:hypothetical protein
MPRWLPPSTAGCCPSSVGSSYLGHNPRSSFATRRDRSFLDLGLATKFKKLVDAFGPAKALETLGADPEFCAITVAEWIEHLIDHLTGQRTSALYHCRAYSKNDIADPSAICR